VTEYVESVKDVAPELVDMIVDVESIDADATKEEYDEVYIVHIITVLT
jgi:hypothetical protein